jgi:hypothetical protein
MLWAGVSIVHIKYTRHLFTPCIIVLRKKKNEINYALGYPNI